MFIIRKITISVRNAFIAFCDSLYMYRFDLHKGDGTILSATQEQKFLNAIQVSICKGLNSDWLRGGIAPVCISMYQFLKMYVLPACVCGREVVTQE